MTSRPETFPKEGAGYILSAEPGPDDETWNRPVAGPDLWTVVNPQEARNLLGSVAIRKRGLSVSLYHFAPHVNLVFASRWQGTEPL